MTEFGQRQRFFEALARAVLAPPQPLLLLIDDLQWCDQETLEWLHFLLRFAPSARLFIVGTARIEEVNAKHPLTRLLLDLRNANQLTEIDLKRLDAAEATQLYRDTEGNPLFVIEMARGELGKDVQAGDRTALRLPPRVHAVIASRLGQLSDSAMEVMSLGATIGRAFSFDVLAQASDTDEEGLSRSLDELWQRRIVRAQDASANTYDFTHDKLREVAYAELSPAKRRLLHRRAARAIEAVHATDLDSVSAQLAAQYEQAGMDESAITFYIRAAQVMQCRFAYAEVVRFIKRGRSLLHAQKDLPRRAEQELALLSLVSTLPVGSVGLQVSEQLEMLTRAQTLTQQLGKPPNLSVLRMLAINHILNSDYRQSRIIGEQLLVSAEALQDSVLAVEGNYVLGVTHFYIGAFERARTHLSESIRRYNPEKSHLHLAMFAWDPKVICLCRQAINLWCLGFFDQALQAHEESLVFATAIGHPFSLAYARFHGALLHYLRRDVTMVRRAATTTIELSREHGFEFWLNQSIKLEGWATAAAGNLKSGIAKMESGMTGSNTLGIQTYKGVWATLFAEHYAKLGLVDRGIKVLRMALDGLANTTDGEHWYEAELHRMMGDVLLTRDVNAAWAAYSRAVGIARSQNARSLELRATVRLAQLWQSQGKIAEARNLLAPVYDWFTEGFDTSDLQEARKLLEQLSK